MTTDARRVVAAERIERLRRDARSEARVPGPVRRRAGAMLVSAGLRVAGQCVWFVAAEPAYPSLHPDGAAHDTTLPR